MRRAAIFSRIRTPVGKFGGALRNVPVEALAALVIEELVKTTQIDPMTIRRRFSAKDILYLLKIHRAERGW